MQEIYQKSISTPIYLEGIGLHSGKNSKIKIIPAKEDQGIVFKRIDLKKENLIEANYKNVSSAKLCTTLENQYGAKVSTVEHLLAALYIAGVDNAIIEIDNEEVPIMDGSAKEFLEIIQKTEIKTQTKKRKYLKILNKVELIEPEISEDEMVVDFIPSLLRDYLKSKQGELEQQHIISTCEELFLQLSELAKEYEDTANVDLKRNASIIKETMRIRSKIPVESKTEA